MHIIPAYKPAVTLFSREGAVTRFKSKHDALATLGFAWIRDNVGTDFSSRWYCEDNWSWVACKYVMRTDFGQVLTSEDFRGMNPPRASAWRSRYTYCGEGPVPGVRKFRGGGHYFRRMRHMSERRQAALVVVEEGEVAPRPSRNTHGLPNPWDDYRVTSRDDRNWKRYRKTRWKPSSSD